MEILSPSWFSELAMEDPIFMDQSDRMDPFDEDLALAFGDEFQNSVSSQSNSSPSTLIPRSSSTTTLCVSSSVEAPPHNVGFETQSSPKKHKPDAFNQCSSTPIILDFSKKSGVQDLGGAVNKEDDIFTAKDNIGAAKSGQVTKKGGGRSRPPSQSYDHIIAERKRREQLSQRFVALSTIVPGLKKTDKTSVLGDAIKYMKQLQERVKTLEEQTTKQTMESVVLVKKSQLLIEDEGSSDEISPRGCNDSLPEIEVRLWDKSVLLKIHCQKHKGVLVNVLSNIENMNMSVANTSVSSFGTLALDITIIAEMEKDFNMTVKDIVRSIRSTLLEAI